MRAAIRAEVLKIATVRGLWITWIVATVSIPVIVLAIVGGRGLAAGGSVVSGAVSGFLLPLLLFGVWAAAVGADEFARETIIVSIALEPRRIRLFVAKSATVALAAVVGVAIGLAVSVPAVIMILPPGATPVGPWYALVWPPLVAAAVSVTGVAVGVAARSTLTAVGIVVIALLFPGAAGGLLGAAQPWIAGADPSVVVARLVHSGTIGAAETFPAPVGLALVIVVGVSVVIAAVAARRFVFIDI
ncbi:hypothetical protein QSJ19_19075 [Gordonia sp. ABSL11-1]|uniref:hypothetical protein n=1 Tax=Gordonia sp. ABSL11-1 TaxID=3053924 RepID=UPI0025726EA6|nr:hypothetical protein [Gordonia sp. ABSL11-1]MDL9947645.1 hypothetical protein [Gordonia sp. ABSL11-1]